MKIQSKRSGFSLIELVITMTIMAILVGVVSMRAGGQTDKAQATKIMKIADELKTACALYHADTGFTAREYSNYQGATYHRLALDPGVTGWAGPYLEKPLNRSMAPTAGNIHLYNYSPSGYTGGNGFDLDGDGTVDVAGQVGNNSNCLVVWGVDQEVAEHVDEAFDRNLPGDWTDAGQVEYTAGSRRLAILIYHH